MGYHAKTVSPRFVIDKMEKEMKKLRDNRKIIIVSQNNFFLA